MSSLICPKCKKSSMKWIADIESEDLLEKGIMECKLCKEQFVGMPGFIKAIEKYKPYYERNKYGK